MVSDFASKEAENDGEPAEEIEHAHASALAVEQLPVPRGSHEANHLEEDGKGQEREKAPEGKKLRQGQ